MSKEKDACPGVTVLHTTASGLTPGIMAPTSHLPFALATQALFYIAFQNHIILQL